MTVNKLSMKQIDWLRLMRANLRMLHIGWYGFDGSQPVKGGMDQELFAETNRKIRSAASRLGIEVEHAGELAERCEWWDGELYGDLVVLDHVLDVIEGSK